MAPWLMLLGQAVAGPPAPVPPRIPSDRPCAPSEGDAGDVVVCGRVGESPYRLKRLPERYSSTPDALPKAEVGVFGGSRLAVEAEQGADAQGGPINRAMMRLKIPLGGRKR